MKVSEAIQILENVNPELPIFICLNIDSGTYLRNIARIKSVISLDGLVNCDSYIGVIPSAPVEIKCPI